MRRRPGLSSASPTTHRTPLRYTAASRLVQQGVPLYDIQRMLGHESPQITARYAHLAPDAHGAVEAAWQRIRDAAPHQNRMGPRAAGETPA